MEETVRNWVVFLGVVFCSSMTVRRAYRMSWYSIWRKELFNGSKSRRKGHCRLPDSVRHFPSKDHEEFKEKIRWSG